MVKVKIGDVEVVPETTTNTEITFIMPALVAIEYDFKIYIGSLNGYAISTINKISVGYAIISMN
jgi:hypothetical protein